MTPETRDAAEQRRIEERSLPPFTPIRPARSHEPRQLLVEMPRARQEAFTNAATSISNSNELKRLVKVGI